MSDREETLIVDDVADDALAAFKEVMERGSEAPYDAGKPSIETVDTEGSEKPADGSRNFNRDEHGRFAPKSEKAEKTASQTDTKPDTKPDATADKKADDKDDGPKIETAHKGGPPPSWSVKSKAAWDQLPAEVKADITKREQEVAQGLATLRDYKDLKPYAEMARQHGTTIKAALDNYVGIENVLRQNLPAGLQQIAQNFGLTQEQAGHLFLDMGQRLLGGKVPQNGAQQKQKAGIPGLEPDDPLHEILNPVVTPLLEKISALESKLTSREQADRNAQMQSLDSQLVALSSRPEFRFANELMPHMVKLFEAGLVQRTGNFEADFKTAYDMAARLHPEVSEALIEQRLREKREAERKREQEAAEKARNASRSLSGSPTPGMTITEPTPEGLDDVEADVRRAMRSLAMV